ncbi:MAG: hypothetical protein V3S08_03900 [Phycisphaerales bacterium]
MSSHIRITFRPRDNKDALDLLKDVEKQIRKYYTSVDATIEVDTRPRPQSSDDEQLEGTARMAVSDELDALAGEVEKWKLNNPDSPSLRRIKDRQKREEQMLESANLFAKLGIKLVAVVKLLVGA